ncbi:Sensor histidine kinase LiaS [Nonomuraea coxensis DSM 45129]|uniref:histidine kinase n=1 Tax=Nonomuraea coxensis DSM 45129 TaxID=1122611 RepID=A0ABX8TZZ7_9ACTN|nr:sensor histidine kinase [Nonomuraea coxensis]QYC41010.1 Sensor histidine kinase LiaS [Nonomuraea coxensis DSM 45129]
MRRKQEAGRRGLLAALRADLWSTAADPLPRMRGPRPLARLPHVLVVLYALVLGLFPDGAGIDPTVPLLATAQAAALVAAMFRPLPAFWASLAVVLAGARAGMTYLPQTLTFPWMVEREAPGAPLMPRILYADPVAFPWTGSGIFLHAGVLFLLALRVRPRAAAETLAVSVLAAAACVVFLPEQTGGTPVVAVPVYALAVASGTMVRMLRTTRTRLEAQEELTAEERAHRTLLQERSRIARELHDVVAHHMSVISIQAQVAPHLVHDPPDELRENLAGIRGNAVEALTELRRILGVLRTEDTAGHAPGQAPQPTLDRLGELLANVRGAGVTLTVEIAGERRPLAPGVELSAFRIVQEALSNAMRHAPGAAVTLRLGYRPDALTIRVVNAAPAKPAPPSDGGHGLPGMRERAAMLGGDLAAGPTPDGGYEVSAYLPAGTPAAPEKGDETLS